jgi:NAD-dependent dihydropyrimidine dehydrogenase PreA subunit
MAVREIVRIDEDKCTGCGDCVPSCAEGALQIVDGKAKLIAENLCDGLGACLGHCPEDAIIVERREADEFDEEAVEEHLQHQRADKPRPQPAPMAPISGGCPGSRVMQTAPRPDGDTARAPAASQLTQWPVQLHLVPPTAPFFQGADVVLAADCVAFAMGDFHDRLLKGRALAVACPKLDQGQEMYLEKLTAMIDDARINTLTVAIMQVPCCGGLVRLAMMAAGDAERHVPIKMVRVGLQGEVLDEEWLQPGNA